MITRKGLIAAKPILKQCFYVLGITPAKMGEPLRNHNIAEKITLAPSTEKIKRLFRVPESMKGLQSWQKRLPRVNKIADYSYTFCHLRESQNRKMVEVAREFWMLSCPTPCSSRGSLRASCPGPYPDSL